MDRNDRETRDFMSVESFSQLPFIRPAPPPVKENSGGSSSSSSAIRLFGKDFRATTNSTNINDNSDDQNHNTSSAATAGEGEASKELTSDTTTSSRKFECHYCCRNFPTSQALGGHQNAHKRERQNAKRAHLQSVMLHGGGISIDARDHHYGLINYRSSAAPPPYLSNWTTTSSGGATTGLYGGLAPSYNALPPQPINGSPLQYWRINPAAHTPSSSSPFLHHRQISSNPLMINSKSTTHHEQLNTFSAITTASSQSRFAFESKPASMQDHVSLDLHL